jgi:hypothetical protein
MQKRIRQSSLLNSPCGSSGVIQGCPASLGLPYFSLFSRLSTLKNIDLVLVDSGFRLAINGITRRYISTGGKIL